MNEFEIIQRYFKRSSKQDDHNVIVGIGDDAAVIQLPKDQQLVLCMDTLVSGVHFPVQAQAADIAYKSLAVNLSDMAAMGAKPHWITLSLTTPEFNEAWYAEFAESFHALASEYSLELVGGDLSRGPLSITVQLQGLVTTPNSLLRSGAKPGDDIYVTGNLGGAAYALKTLTNPEQWEPANRDELLRLHRPKARVELGEKLSGVATSCIDISDGLYADLSHVLIASQVGAEIELKYVPLSSSLHKLEEHVSLELALSGGDDYELCFTLPADINDDFVEELQAICPIVRVGKINDSNSLVLKDNQGKEVTLTTKGYRHF